jgi:hypothetical protein
MASEKKVKLISRIIDSCEEVPEYFMDGFKYSCLSCLEFPYSVYVVKLQDKEEEMYSQLITASEDGLYIFERKNNRVTLNQYNYEELIFIKKENGDLHSMIEIKGMINGRVFKNEIEFDNKDEDIFDFMITSIRMKGKLTLDFEEDQEEKYGEDNYELLKLGYFKDSNLKLYNYCVESLISGRKIKKTVFQKKLVKKRLKLIKRVLTTSHIIILTSDELIIVEEGKSKRRSPEANIGGYWYFIPVSQITSMDIKSSDNLLLTLTIRLKGNEQIEMIYENPNRTQLEQLAKSALIVYQHGKTENKD